MIRLEDVVECNFCGTTEGPSTNAVINCRLTVSLTDVAQFFNLRHGDATIFDLRRLLSMPEAAEDGGAPSLLG